MTVASPEDKQSQTLPDRASVRRMQAAAEEMQAMGEEIRELYKQFTSSKSVIFAYCLQHYDRHGELPAELEPYIKVGRARRRKSNGSPALDLLNAKLDEALAAKAVQVQERLYVLQSTISQCQNEIDLLLCTPEVDELLGAIEKASREVVQGKATSLAIRKLRPATEDEDDEDESGAVAFL